MLEKITVLKTFALSKLWYQANFYVLSEIDIRKVESLSFSFIWGGCELIKRNTLIMEYREGGLNMVSIRAKLQAISIRNFMYIKRNIGRPQYQLSIYWLKFHLRDYLENFNIIPTGLDKDRPLFFKEMIRNITLFKDLYNTWAQNVNEVAQRKIDQYNLNAIKKRTFKPVEPKFLNNFRTLTSKFIYNQFLLQFKIIPEFYHSLPTNEKNTFLSS